MIGLAEEMTPHSSRLFFPLKGASQTHLTTEVGVGQSAVKMMSKDPQFDFFPGILFDTIRYIVSF